MTNTLTDTASLSAELETVVRSVPGVTTVYPAAPLIATIVSTVVDAVVGALTQRDTVPTLVTLSTGKAGLKVSASIGVTDADSAADVCRRVYDTIAAHPTLRAVGPIDIITVRVSSIS